MMKLTKLLERLEYKIVQGNDEVYRNFIMNIHRDVVS